MRPQGTRILRRLLLGVVVAVVVAVAWTLRPSPSGPEGPTTAEGPPEGTTIGDVSFFRFDAGEQKLKIDARSWKGEEDGLTHLEGVKVTFPYVARGEESTAVITSDEGSYDPRRQRAHFRGNVNVVTEDGFEMTTESLDYLGDEGLVRSEEQIQFVRGAVRGRSRGAEYVVAQDRLVLQSEVWMRFEDEGEQPTEIEAGRAFALRRRHIVNFGQGVIVRQGARVLRSEQLLLTLDGPLEAIKRIAAIENVDLVTGGGGDFQVAAVPSGGQRRLRCRRLNVFFRSKGVLREAIAVNGAVLDLMPGPRDPPEKRRLSGRAIKFGFDQQGRLSSLVSWTGRPRFDEGPVELITEPLEPPGEVRKVVCQDTFLARIDAESGEVTRAEFRGEVEFSEADRRAWADNAAYDAAGGLLRLTGGAPRIRDEAEGSDLQAQRIDIRSADESVFAVGGVRHTMGRRGVSDGGGILAGTEPTVLVSHEFEYHPSTRTAWYRENALLRSGEDEVRAPLIVLEEPTPAERRLHASGGVISVLHPRGGGQDRDPPPEAVTTRSTEMVYEESARRVVYSGDVEIRQGDILTRSPEAVVTLDKTGREVDRIVAGEPVEVYQGQRRATGQTGTYTPGSETLVLEGQKVVLQDAERRVEGRVLTFQVGEDRIRVDGREEVRTEAIFRQKGPSTP
jgi:LPS export ABC transporter protein LptC/lipopolysaccharide transport protein LptA